MKRILITLSMLLLLPAGGIAAPASPEDNFFKGKVLVLIVPYSPGGGYDAYARMIIQYKES